VVVEGVARGLDPNLNIWEVAQPIVSGYVSKNVGPRALLRDLVQTAQVLARFGPKLPRMVENALIARADKPTPLPPRREWRTLVYITSGAALVALGAWIGTLI
jgi:ubiquinone biosynthesis protein